jgi:hypothetical protein
MIKQFYIPILLLFAGLIPAGQDLYGRPGREPGSHSVLSEGDWFKISVARAGIHKIGYAELQSYGLDPAAVNPNNLKIYGNGGKMLSESTSQPRPDDLVENSIMVVGEEDGVFDPGDYILFYAEGPLRWNYSPFYQKFEHEVNLYTDKIYYFLTAGPGPGKRIVSVIPPSGDPTIVVSTFNDFACHELDSLNLIKSGKEWYGEVYHNIMEYEYTFKFPFIDFTSPAYFKSNLVARSTETSNFSIYYEDDIIGNQEIGSINEGNSIYARTMTTPIIQFTPQGSVLRFKIIYDKPNQTSTGWMNYIEVNAVSKLVFDGGQLAFRNVSSVGPGNLVQFNIVAQEEGFDVWDITYPSGIFSPGKFVIENGYGLKAASDTLREYIAFERSAAFFPVFESKVANQDLHSMRPPNMIILVHPAFMTEALRLADFHRQYSRLTVNVLTPQQIYNEFSSGAPEITAIRDFLKMLFDRGDSENELRYLLLFGDASYDYKDRLENNSNLVPTFQSMESLKTASSFVTDDFFGCLDYGEGSNASGTVDIGIGRFPVNTLEESISVVDKVIHYASAVPDVSGDWRNKICLVADDEDNNIHLNQVEELVTIIDSLVPGYNVGKIYLDAYLQQNTPTGYRFPEASQAIDNAVSGGLLIINYTGHGGETGWAHEKVVDLPMITGWTNQDLLPAFVTATCEFSRFDDPGLVSAGEWVLLNPKGGGIGLFTTTRLAYSQSNVALNKRFYEAAFDRDSITGEYPRMGDLMKHAKTPSSQNIKNFVLLGDPAISLAYPFLNVSTTSINNELSGKETDTLHALSLVTVTGRVEDIRGNLVSSFQGLVYPEVYDKPVLYQTRGNDITSKVKDFYIQNKILFKGEATVTDGLFSFSFLVPKDISYQFGLGKISYYALDTINYIDAQGFTPVYVGGTEELVTEDSVGPQIRLFLNDTTFVSGDYTTMSPVLVAHLFDESGINTVGNGIGHDISAVLDGYTQNPFILNDYYTSDPDTYKSGQVTYPFGNLTIGTHSLTLKAWDVYNNSTETSITFVIDTVAPLTIKSVFNYPNPFREGTHFVFSHNKPGSNIEAEIDIFDMFGRHVRTLQYQFTSENMESGPLYWNGMDEDGNFAASGIYVFRLRADSGGDRYAVASQKMIIVR